MLTIRLSRIGKKKKPMYRLIISEKTKDPYGRALEILGTYNPFNKEMKVKEDRIKYWLSQGAGMSATVNNLLIHNKIIEGKKQKSYYPKKKKKDESTEASKPVEAKKSVEVKKTVETSQGASPEKPEEKKESAPEEKKEKPKSDEKTEVKKTAETSHGASPEKPEEKKE